jgi:pSer/pThr/pTyr-binding forkhead associated (FHA) protein
MADDGLLYLVVSEGIATRELPLTEPITIGRAHGNAIVLDGGQASRIHARIEPRHGAAIIVDLGSLNGTYVNGERVPARDIRGLVPGDVIDIGAARITVERRPPLLPGEEETDPARRTNPRGDPLARGAQTAASPAVGHDPSSTQGLEPPRA